MRCVAEMQYAAVLNPMQDKSHSCYLAIASCLMSPAALTCVR
jgi:hypothetical protein